MTPEYKNYITIRLQRLKRKVADIDGQLAAPRLSLPIEEMDRLNRSRRSSANAIKRWEKILNGGQP